MSTKTSKVNSKMFNNLHQSNNLFEGLEEGDLARVVHPKLHIDEFKSKMGDDADILVLSFKLTEKDPATDLMSFIERGYEWVLDADISTGELEDSSYLVFVEAERNPQAAKQIDKLIDDLLNLTAQNKSEWRFQYQKNKLEYPISADNIRKIVPLTPDSYISKYSDDKLKDKINALKETARVPMDKQAPVNSFTDSLRIAAGIK
jgi:hypothetical protein